MDSVTDVELGGVDEDGLRAFVEAFDRNFGTTTTDEGVERFGGVAELDRLVAARTATGEVVGTAGAYTFDLALPYAPPAGCAGITVVSVRGDHRRRGILTHMMAALLRQAGERGEPFAALWASEAPIYGRFGFGPAAPTLMVELDRAQARLRTDVAVEGIRLVERQDAAHAFPAIYDAVRAGRPGMLSRSSAWWQRILGDPPEQRDGAGPLRLALLPGRGYAIHRLHAQWEAGAPNGTVELLDLVAVDPEAYASMWRFVIDTDLAAGLRAGRRPADDPIVAMLIDQARAKVAIDWPLYLRLVDLPAALQARGYGVEDELVLAVEDRFLPHNTGAWRLTVRDGRGSCRSTGASADLSVDAEALGTVALGGVRSTSLAMAGRLTEHTDGAAARLDRLFAGERAPWHGGMF